MPALRSKPAAEAPIVEALVGGTYKVDGVRLSVHRGEKVRADSALVKARPTMFVPIGVTDLERQHAFMAYESWKEDIG